MLRNLIEEVGLVPGEPGRPPEPSQLFSTPSWLLGKAILKMGFPRRFSLQVKEQEACVLPLWPVREPLAHSDTDRSHRDS